MKQILIVPCGWVCIDDIRRAFLGNEQFNAPPWVHLISALVLVAAAGLWLQEHKPVPKRGRFE